MSLAGKYYDNLGVLGSWIGGSSEFDWFINRTADILYGDGPRTWGVVGPGTAPPPVQPPVVISEVPQTWEELEVLHPEVFEPILETRPGRTPDPYPIAERDTALQKDDDMAAWDWGAAASGVIDILQGQNVGGGNRAAVYSPPDAFSNTGAPSVPSGGLSRPIACDMEDIPWVGGTPPKGYKVVNYCGKGVLRKVRRRRRRRMLTASDASDLATIVGIVGKGQMASSMINRTRS